jgi:hypothetical protein
MQTRPSTSDYVDLLFILLVASALRLSIAYMPCFIYGILHLYHNHITFFSFDHLQWQDPEAPCFVGWVIVIVVMISEALRSWVYACMCTILYDVILRHSTKSIQ